MPKTLPAPHKFARLESAPNRKRWTRHECEFLVKNGLLVGRYELVDGEVISKMGQNPPHACVVRCFMAWLVSVFGADFVSIQLPIDVAEAERATNEPEPDAAVLARPNMDFIAGNPRPVDLRLVVEISDSSADYDLINKAALYARAGIVEYWVADLPNRRIVVHRRPGAEGYAEILEYAESETIATLARPEASVTVANLLPPNQPVTSQ